MATQLAETDPVEPPEGEGEPRDYEAEARAQGWSPKDDFKGDPNRWVDAETFVKRADEMMPLIKAQLKHVRRELEEQKRTTKRFAKFAQGAEERIRAEIRAEMEEAVKSGDLTGFKAAQKRADDLDKDTEAKGKYTGADLIEAFDEFRDSNVWYDKGALGSATEEEINARIYADRLIEKRLAEIKPGDEPPPGEFLAGILDAVKEKYPALGSRPPRQKPASDVAGGSLPGRSRGTKTWDALPAEAKAQYERFIRQGLGDKEYYVKSHDWDGYAKEAAR